MKKLLMTGGTGFIGKNVRPILEKNYKIVSPRREELDLMDHRTVETYLEQRKFDAVLHFANPSPAKNELDTMENLLEDSLRMFINFYRCRNMYGKMIYLGSGAQFDKTLEIANITEQERNRSVPKDAYGFAKLLMDELARKSENIYNLCVFGIYGPWDHASKFITHCIRCCLRNKPITIRQDCWFDYLHVTDLPAMIAWMIEGTPKYHTYNAGSGRRVLLSEIAKEVRRQMGVTLPIEISSPGLNREYTANNSRIMRESGIVPTIQLEQGISMQINWEREHQGNEEASG